MFNRLGKITFWVIIALFATYLLGYVACAVILMAIGTSFLDSLVISFSWPLVVLMAFAMKGH